MLYSILILLNRKELQLKKGNKQIHGNKVKY